MSKAFKNKVKLNDMVSVKDFGAVGDGVTDDTTPILLALNSGAKVVDGQGLTYKLTSNITPTCENIVVQNAVFDISSITGGGPAIKITGTQAAGVSLTADILSGSKSIVVGNTSGFAADEYAWLTSNEIFDAGTGTILGQIVKIKSVDSSTAMTLYDDALYAFNTSASAAIAKLTLKKNITLRNIQFLGANTGIQSALYFEKCVNVTIDGCGFEYVDYGSVVLDRCVNVTITNTSVRHARSVGLSYGFIVGNGCYSVKVSNCYGEDTRHLITVGNNDGVNLFVAVSNCHAAASRDAGIDSHPACDYMVIDGNTVECAPGPVDGIIFQGLNCIISNNTVVGNIGVGIRHQLLPDIGAGSCIISNNHVQVSGSTGGTDTGIQVTNEGGGASLNGVTIEGNRITGTTDYGIYVYALTGNVKNVSISGNLNSSDATLYACFVRSEAAYSVQDFTISGNVFRSAGVSNVYLLGTTTPTIINGTVTGNAIKGGTNGIRMIQTQNVVETGNYNTGVTRKVFVDTGSSNITMDRRQSSVVTVTSATYTVLDQDEHLIANRASTITMTLPDATVWPGRELTVKTVQAQTVVSAASNVVPVTDTVAGTAILAATDGAWAVLKSDGTSWIIMQRG